MSLRWWTAALLAVQVLHGAIPSDTEAGSALGFYLGILALLATIVALVGLVRRAPWATRFAAFNGGVIAVGVVLYHGLPVDSSTINSYWYQNGSFLQWVSVVLVIGTGAACAWLGREQQASLRLS